MPVPNLAPINMAPGDQCRIAIFQLTGKRWGWLVLTGGLAESLDRASLDVPKAAKSTDSFASSSFYPRPVGQTRIPTTASPLFLVQK